MIPQLFNAQMAQYATPTVTGESSVVIEDGIKCYLPELKASGNTTQQTYTGANILNIPAFKLSGSSNDLGWHTSLNGDSITISAENATTRSISILGGGKQVITAGKYRLSVDKPLPFNLRLQNSAFLIPTGKTSQTFTYTGADFVNKAIAVDAFPTSATSWTVEPITFKLMLQKIDDVAPIDDYEPYTGGKPVPNPEWPTDIINAGDNDIEVEVKGSNLFDIDRFVKNAQNNGLPEHVLYKIENGIYVGQYSYLERYANIDFGFKKGKQYTISFTYETVKQTTEERGSCNITFVYADNTSSNVTLYLNHVGYTENKVLTSKKGKDVVKISISGWQYNGAINIIDIMLVEGDTIAKYEPYVEPQTITIPSSVVKDNGEVVDLRFAKVGDYVDTLIVDGLNKKVIYQQWNNKKTLSEEGAWAINEYALGSTGKNYYQYKPDLQNKVNNQGFCNLFPRKHWVTNKDNVFFVVSPYFIFRTDGVETLDEWKAKVKGFADNGTPLEILYTLRNPIEHDITNTPLGEQLLALVQNNGTTIIEIKNDNNLSQTLSAKYLTHS